MRWEGQAPASAPKRGESMAVVPGVHLAVSPRICPAPGGHRQARAAAVSDPPSSARLEPQRPQTGSRDSRKWSTCAQQCQPCEPEHSGTQRHAHGAALGKSGASATACLQQPRRDRFPLSCESAQQRGRRYQVCPVEADVPSRVRGYPVVEEAWVKPSSRDGPLCSVPAPAAAGGAQSPLGAPPALSRFSASRSRGNLC